MLIIIFVLIIILIPALLLLKKARDARFAEEGHARRQRLDYQPVVKPNWIAIPIPISKRLQKQQPAVPGTDADFLENCKDLQQCLIALAGKYSLDSFTIATSDGLVFASSGGVTTQEDAARYNRKYNDNEPKNVTMFSLNHKGSELTGIIRPKGIITRETLNRIENDTQDILNKWI